MSETSFFAKSIMEQKYSHELEDGRKETWSEIADRVSFNVMKALNIRKNYIDDVKEIIEKKQFIPGGRYLYAAGRPFHQVQNCLLLRAEDSREGWADLMQKSAMALMTGAGIGIDYSLIRPEGKPVRKTGGVATGPLALMQMVNEAGRGIMQGGARRSAIWAGLNWKHADAHKFVAMKNWIPEVRSLKEKDFNFPATMDGTNISIQLDDEFFKAYGNEKHSLHSTAQSIYWAVVRQMLKTAEPGFSVDTGENAGETLRNAPVSANTYVLSKYGYVRVGDIVDDAVVLWTGKQYAGTVFRKTGENVPVVKVRMSGDREIVCSPEHPFILKDGTRVNAEDLKPQDSLMISLPENKYTPVLFDSVYYTLGYVYGDGTFNRSYPRAEVTLCTDASKKCLDGLSRALITSFTEKDSRGYTRVYFGNNDIFKDRHKAIFPEDLFSQPDRAKVAFIAGLFDSDGNYFEKQNRVRLSSKHKDFLVGVRRLLESLGIMSGISTAGISTYGGNVGYMLTVNTEHVTRFKQIITGSYRLNIQECTSYRAMQIKVISVEDAGYEDVFCCDVGVEEHSFMAEGVIISNCTEVTSRSDSDICNLGSINMANITSLAEMKKVTELAILFLLAGTVYSHVPYTKVDEIRTKNRRLGLGLMGIHEWLLTHGKKYGPDAELQKYLEIYATSTEIAKTYADKYDLSAPIKTRAIAPTGTIGIIAETTTGIEPIFCLVPGTRILTEDLDWVVIENLNIGDTIIGFREEPLNFKTNKFKAAKVIASTKIMQPVYKITTDKGVVQSSYNHLWVVRPTLPPSGQTRKGQGWQWAATHVLKEGMEIAFTTKPWENDFSFDGGDSTNPAKIISIEYVGEKEVIALETSTNTFIAEGFLSHNCVAYKRRYKKGSDMNAFQYVVDPAAKRLIEKGVNPDHIEDAYVLADDVERRVSFQAWVQTYVDHSISSTINLPEWGSEKNNDNTVHDFGSMLIKYLPNLRGITCYPDGARGGQPLSPIRYGTAIKHIGEVFYEGTDICEISKSGSCGG